ncbi:MAG: type IV pili twitching motility protein PilT [Gracilibacter sp. BRH_c7a]|nr:MAG: type IV pili twitching motility protein PilT [Gracilibacter sp. BRH_c7a]
MQSLEELLKKAGNFGASDIHLTVASPPVFRIDGELKAFGNEFLNKEHIQSYINKILTDEQYKTFSEQGDLDLSFGLPGLGRYRINAFFQGKNPGLVIRIIPLVIKTPEELEFPSAIVNFASLHRGLILVTGPTGSGKSTTLASLINLINNNRSAHIITIEDPVEFVHSHRKCLVNQRELGQDTQSFSNALRAALRQDPDIILVGEMRDLETISMAVTAAETGHLVFSTLHTNDAPQAIDRIIDVFPPYQQSQIRVQLASVLQGIVAQQLFPLQNKKGRIAAYEVLIATTAVRNMIREGKTHQLKTIMQTSSQVGMITMEKAVEDLAMRGLISDKVVKERIHE